ncbi:MFS transporter [Pseudonocardia humida]|uniref:MFS transporter n=1 Tax=Pseudonocardia humida TaxID=2800819 RepID=A0ABT0ZRU0_9PSEU|nr:MFS transporter [Pseudonocardia humida]MCO1653430.1 MFS transporter [Pseudonocardia humida]
MSGPATSRWSTVVVVSLGIVLGSLDMTIVAVALPAIGAELGAGPSSTQWVLLGYLLPLVALSLPAGRWLDRAGPRAAFRLAVGGFGAASALVALAPGIELLVAARVLQGGFAALLSVLGLPIVAGAVRPEHRARAMSIVLTLIPLSGVVGPAVGGLLTDAVGWRTIFLVNLPVAAAALALAGLTIPAGPPGRTGLPRPDRAAVTDAVVLGAGTTALVLALDLLSGPAPALAPAGALAVAGAIAVAVWARRPDSRPVLALLRHPRIGWSLLALLVTIAGVGAVNFLIPYALADGGTDAATTGLVLLVLSAAMALTSPPAGVLADRIGTAPVVLAGAVLVLGGAGWLLAVGPGPGPGALLVPMALVGAGNGLFAGPNATRVLDATPPGEIGASSGLSSLVRTTAFTLGPALAAAAWTAGTGNLTAGAVLLVALAAVGVLAALPRRRPVRL